MAHTYTIIYINDKPIITKKRVKVKKMSIEDAKKLDAKLKKESPLD
jgi:hypothetical protein